MATEVLRPQDCLIDRIRVPPPVTFSRRRNNYGYPNSTCNGNNNYYYYGNSNGSNSYVNGRSSRNRLEKPEQRRSISKRSSSDDLKTVKLDKVTILRRGESLDSKIKSEPLMKEAGGGLAVCAKMGAGGKNSRLERAPHTTPPFTLSQLKKAIPPHCFNRSLLRSFSYVLQDLFFAFLFYYIATSYFHFLPHPLQYLAWPLYWIFQGSIFAGIWVLGHDCGHQAFSDHQWVDDTVGFVLHSALLFPYFSFKYSHRRHHSNIGSLEHDQLFVPVPESQIAWLYKRYLDNPLGRALKLSIIVFLGFPLYLGFNLTGKQYDRSACHYDPYSPLYSKSERLHILISDIGVFITTLVLYQLGSTKGLSWVVFMYGVPLFTGNSILVTIAYLNHTHSSLPHYDSSEWDWLKGALSTVDRNYGSILNRVFYHLTDAHVAHHLFATIPHYHANEATKAIKPILGEYYSFDDTPIIKALWRETKECVYIEPNHESSLNNNKGVFWYNNKF